MDGGLIRRIETRLNERFGERADPELMEGLRALPPGAMVMYAYMFRSLPFAHPFDCLGPMSFHEGIGPTGDHDPEGPAVWAFGTHQHFSTSELGGQVRVLWHRFVMDRHARYDDCSGYESIDQHFIVELRTRSPEDRLILAKITPEPTLSQTIDRVLLRLRRPNVMDAATVEAMFPPINEALGAIPYGQRREICRQMGAPVSRCAELMDMERLQVPIMDFKVLGRFHELLGRTAVCENPALNGMPMVEGVQTIRFRLNEHGAVLESEGSGGLFSIGPSRYFDFDRPFLVMLLREGADRPYFALWVGNAELLQKVSEEETNETADPSE